MNANYAVGARFRRARPQRGFTMLEVLVALLILLIGLLGLAGMLVTTQQGEVEAYQRKQATVLVQDMVDRMLANHVAADCYVTTAATGGSASQGTGYGGSFACGGGTGARAVADLQAWNNALLGTSEKKGVADVGSIIDARGCVTSPEPRVYTVSVAWRGLAPTVAPPAAYACGQNQYTDERLRRVISVTVRVGNLIA